MADSISSTNMGMPIPIVGTTPGPDYGSDNNACFTILDGHDHSAGYGVPINPSGLNINSDLTFAGNNLTAARSVRFQIQSAPLGGASDLGCIYESGVDLYYNDGNGNQVRITQSGGVAGSPGSIASLASPASATYVSANQTFVWQSDANTPANMDGGSVLIRNILANSKALTLSAPAAMGSNYTITLPSLPASQKFMTLDASGNMSAPWAVDNSSIEVSSNTIQVKALGITKPMLAALGQQVSSSCGDFFTTSTSFVDVTNLSVSITTTGRPVMIMIIPDGAGVSYFGISRGASAGDASFKLLRGATTVGIPYLFYDSNGATTGAIVQLPPGALNTVDIPSAGTYTYKLQAKSSVASVTSEVFGCKLLVYEL